MFRNGFGSRTQTSAQPQPNTFTGTGTPNVLGSQTNNVAGFSNPPPQIISQTDDEIMFAIVTGNLTNVRRLVTSANVNRVIDRKNGYTSLHHAVRIKKNDSIIEYLLGCGADPKLKQDEGFDSVDLAIEANYRYLIDKMLRKNEEELDNLYTKYDDLNYKVKGFEQTNQELTKTNEYLTRSNVQYVEKISELKTENTNLKRKYDESEKAFSNLLKKTKKN
jgi:uncharacterized protein YdcH (DUF465 family)